MAMPMTPEIPIERMHDWRRRNRGSRLSSPVMRESAKRSRIGGAPLGARCRPGVEVVNVVAHVAPVLSIFGPATDGAHLLQRPPRQADVVRRLRRAEKRAALLRSGGSLVFVFHGHLAVVGRSATERVARRQRG